MQKWLGHHTRWGCTHVQAVEHLKNRYPAAVAYSDVRPLPIFSSSFWFLLPERCGLPRDGRTFGREITTPSGRLLMVVLAAGAITCIVVWSVLPRLYSNSIGTDLRTRPSPSACCKPHHPASAVPQWSSILDARHLTGHLNLHFQAAFLCSRQGPSRTPTATIPKRRKSSSRSCFSLRLRATARLRQACRVRIGLSPNEQPDERKQNIVTFLPVLAYDGANMTQIDAGGNPRYLRCRHLGHPPCPQVGEALL